MCSRRAAERDDLSALSAAALTCRPRAWPAPRTLGVGAITCLFTLLCACAHAQAAIYFRSASTAQTGSGAKEVTISKPAGVVAGDVMIGTVDAEGTGTLTAPSGWSATGLFAGTSFFGYSGVYFHVAGSSEPASYTWSLGTSRKAIGKIVSYVGVENSSPIEVTATTAGANSGTNDAVASIITTVKSTMVILDFAAADSAGSFTITPPASTTKRTSVFTSGSGSVVGSQTQDFLQATAGASGTKTFTTSASIPWGAITIALKPGTGALGFDIAPNVPVLPTLTLNGKAQTTNETMSNFAVDNTSSETGWNVTVNGNTSAGKSPVFKQYCENGSNPCGSTAANSYVSGGYTLPAGSLQLNTTGASWSTTGEPGTAPVLQCNSSCPIDASSATKIVSAASGAGLGPWSTSGFGATSLALSTPTTMRVLPEHEIYSADLLWTLSSGP